MTGGFEPRAFCDTFHTPAHDAAGITETIPL